MWLCHWISSKVMVILLNEHDSCLLEEEYASCEFLPWEKQVLWAYAQVVVSHIRETWMQPNTSDSVSPKTKHPWVPVSMTKNVETMFVYFGFHLSSKMLLTLKSLCIILNLKSWWVDRSPLTIPLYDLKLKVLA